MKTGFFHSEMYRRERELVESALEQHHWNRRQAAKFLGVSYRTVFYMIEKHNLLSPRERMRILRNAERFGLANPQYA
jgi:DNA-binding NtrC family response regulator